MDYTKSPLGFRLRKALRYTRLYGPSRMIVKVRGQYHMNKRYARLPEIRPQGRRGHVGLLGCGNFAYSNIAYYLAKTKGQVMRGAMDTDIHRAGSLYERYGLDFYSDDPRTVIDDEAIDLVYIASNHASHAEYAIDCLKNGKSVHIEKPHVVSLDQLIRLCQEIERSSGAVNLGFNRPNSKIGTMIRDALWSQEGAAMLNWFVAGHAIMPDHWYFKPEEGGRILGNLCHWTDFIYSLVEPENRYPLIIRPTRADRSDCDIAVTYTFGDGTIAVITFSAKGHTFEGVRERFAAHRGDVLISMDDFHTLTIENVAHKRHFRGLFRDHGHAEAILRIYNWAQAQRPAAAGLDVKYVWETGELFLLTRQALEQQREVTLSSFDRSKLLRTEVPEKATG